MIVEKETLKVISWKHPNYDDIYKSYKENEFIFGGGYYLHGKVESYYGYDLCNFLQLPERFTYASHLRNESKTPCRRIKFEGIYNVEVVDYPNECLGFFWCGVEEFHGLIVDKTDFESMKYANECYLNKKEFI